MSDPTVREAEGGEGSQATVRETSVAGTVREGISSTTVREDSGSSGSGSRSGGVGASLTRLPDGLAARYVIERELPTRGTEADLFVVHPLDGGAPVVVKLYRANIHPKDEVQARIAALDGRHVIRQIDYGVSEGRSFEVIEYAAAGSLTDLMHDIRFDNALLRDMIGQVAAGLGYLHGLDPSIVHRDVKPDNVLVRGRDPLDLVLTDFGLASVLDNGSWRASTADRTIKYAAPEASAGQVSREMDWWSLGMMVAEAAGGRHPFAGVSEQAVAIHYSNRLPVPLDAVGDERVRLLCLGLLSYDRKQRWGAAEVECWLDGDQSLRPPVVETRRRAATVPFKFAGGEYGTAKELASALASNWTAAQRTVARADGLLSWLKDDAKEHEAWQWLSEIAQEKAQLDPGLKVTLLLPMLDPALPPMFEGKPLTRERLLAEVEAVAKGTEAARAARLTQLWEHLPALTELCPEAAWLGEAPKACANARTEADGLIRTLGSEAPKLATDSWAFVRHVLAFEYGSANLDDARATAEALLRQVPDAEASWVLPLKAANRSTAGSSWLLRQLEPRLRSLIAEIARREASARAAAEAAAAKAAAEAAAAKAAAAEKEAADTAAREAQKRKRKRIYLASFASVSILAIALVIWRWEIGVDDQAWRQAQITDTLTGYRLYLEEHGWGRYVSQATKAIDKREFRKPVRTFTGDGGQYLHLAVTPDGRYLVTAAMSGCNDFSFCRGDVAKLWDLATGRALRDFRGHRSTIESVAFSPDGKFLVTGGSNDKTARLWDVSTGRQLRVFNAPDGVDSVAVTSDGKSLVTGGEGGTARLWDLSTGQELRAFSGHTKYISSIAVTPDGKYLVTAGGDDTVRLWDLATGKELREFPAEGWVHSVAVSPDGHQLVTAGGEAARLWDIATGQQLRVFKEFTKLGRILSAAFTPDGRHLVTVGEGYFNGHGDFSGYHRGVARLWDLATGQELRDFFTELYQMVSVAVTPDGRYLVTDRHNTALLWELTPDVPIESKQ